MKQADKTALTRQKICEAAEATFSEEGFSAARVDRIAQRAGVNKQMIYAHFGSKEGLYDAVLGAVYDRLSSCEEELGHIDVCDGEGVRRTVLVYMRFLMRNPSFVRLMLWENLRGAPSAPRAAGPLFRGVRRLLQRGVEQGHLRADLDIEQTVLSMNLFCFSAFSNLGTISRITGQDLATDSALEARAWHIAEVLVRYTAAEQEV